MSQKTLPGKFTTSGDPQILPGPNHQTPKWTRPSWISSGPWGPQLKISTRTLKFWPLGTKKFDLWDLQILKLSKVDPRPKWQIWPWALPDLGPDPPRLLLQPQLLLPGLQHLARPSVRPGPQNRPKCPKWPNEPPIWSSVTNHQSNDPQSQNGQNPWASTSGLESPDHFWRGSFEPKLTAGPIRHLAGVPNGKRPKMAKMAKIKFLILQIGRNLKKTDPSARSWGF